MSEPQTALAAIKAGDEVPEIWLDWHCAKSLGYAVEFHPIYKRLVIGTIGFPIDANFIWPFIERDKITVFYSIEDDKWEATNDRGREKYNATGKTAIQAVKRLLILKGIK